MKQKLDFYKQPFRVDRSSDWVYDANDNYVFPAKSVNDLARLKFKEQLLKEIMFDLMVCEIEKWDKKEYINQLKELINGIKTD